VPGKLQNKRNNIISERSEKRCVSHLENVALLGRNACSHDANRLSIRSETKYILGQHGVYDDQGRSPLRRLHDEYRHQRRRLSFQVPPITCCIYPSETLTNTHVPLCTEQLVNVLRWVSSTGSYAPRISHSFVTYLGVGGMSGKRKTLQDYRVHLCTHAHAPTEASPAVF